MSLTEKLPKQEPMWVIREPATCKWKLVRDKLLPPSHNARERREYKVDCSAAGYVLFDLHIGHWNYCPLCGKKIEVIE